MRRCYLLAAGLIALFSQGVYAQSVTETLSPLQTRAACAIPAQLVIPGRESRLRVVGAQGSEPRSLFGQHDLLVINGGSSVGLQFVELANGMHHAADFQPVRR